MNYKGIIIEESLSDTAVLHKIKILRKRKEQVTKRHQTPWISQWTLDTVVVPEGEIETVTTLLSKSIDTHHPTSWYIDLKNDQYHYIVFPHKIFKVDLTNPILYQEAEYYGQHLSIPSYQMQFAKLKRKLE